MPYYIFAWIASISAGIYIAISKITSKYAISNPWYFNFLFSAIVLLFIIPIALFNHASFPTDWTNIGISAVFAALFNISLVLSVYSLDITVLSPLFNFRTVFAVLLGVIFLNEHLSTYQWLIFLMIVIVGMFVTIDEKMSLKSFFKPSIAIGLCTMLFLALNNVFIKKSLIHNSLWTSSMWIFIISFGITLFTFPLFYKDLKKTKMKQIIPIVAMGFFAAITNLFSNQAYKTSVGITSVIMSIPFSMIIVFILSLFIPKFLEKHTVKIYLIRFVCAAIMIYGALQLSR